MGEEGGRQGGRDAHASLLAFRPRWVSEREESKKERGRERGREARGKGTEGRRDGGAKVGRRERERGIGGIGWSDFERRKERKRGRNGDRVGEEGGKGRTEGGTEEAEQGRTSLDRHPRLRAAPRARFRVRVQV